MTAGGSGGPFWQALIPDPFLKVRTREVRR
jgi:hypothetical protein